MASVVLVNTRRRKLREPIRIEAKRFGFFPSAFTWRGRRHDIRAVESCRTENGHGRVRRHIFRVRTDRAVLELTQDVARDAWRIEQMWTL
ncbi:MAG: hypothetical protein RMK99_01555 [Anaerolineales bacterium]|nr:hypothetical protein [Anaerolineales bacterium]